MATAENKETSDVFFLIHIHSWAAMTHKLTIVENKDIHTRISSYVTLYLAKNSHVDKP